MIVIAKGSIPRPDALAPHLDAVDHIAELAARWQHDGHIPPDSDTKAVAVTLFSPMRGLIVMHHLVDDVGAEALRSGIRVLGAAADTSLPVAPIPEAAP
jgi:hypothetical protein